MRRVLLTSATHSLGLRVVNLLTNKFDVVAATSDELPSFIQDKYLKIPKGVNPTFAHEMLKLALDNNIDYILPLQLAEIESLSESLVLFEEYGIRVICPTKSQLTDVEILPNPSKEMELTIMSEGVDLITNRNLNIDVNGLGVLSDSQFDFFIAIAR